jgi:hypothetical protein
VPSAGSPIISSVSGFEPSWSAAAVAAAATERALGRLLRGATWQAITCEIAWRAVVEAGADGDLIEDLTGFADASLSGLADGIECRVDAAAVRAWRAHLGRWPHDHAGAELVATLEAREEAERLVAAAYVETRRETEAAARTRTHAASVREPRRRRFFHRGRPSDRAPIRPIDLGDLGRIHERHGWARRNAA